MRPIVSKKQPRYPKIRVPHLLSGILATSFLVYLLVLSRFRRPSESVTVEHYEQPEVEIRPSANYVDPKPSLEDAKNISSVDYMACCGAGHRMSKLSDANYVSKRLGFALRSFWGYCDTTEVYDYLFGPQPVDEIPATNHRDHFVRINNDVPGFVKFSREGNEKECACNMDKADHDVQFYASHRDRFRAKHKVASFRRKHFLENTTIVGIHIRGGNGENGDFANLGRAIDDTDSWLQKVVNLLTQQNWGPVKMFLATDTPSIIPKLEATLTDRVPVIYQKPIAPKEGSGVMFGARGKVLNTGIRCKRGKDKTPEFWCPSSVYKDQCCFINSYSTVH